MNAKIIFILFVLFLNYASAFANESPEAVMHRFAAFGKVASTEAASGEFARRIRDWLWGDYRDPKTGRKLNDKVPPSPTRSTVSRQEFSQSVGCANPEEAGNKVMRMRRYLVDVEIGRELFEMAYIGADEMIHWASYRTMPVGSWVLFDKETSVGIDLGCGNPLRFHPPEVRRQAPPPEHMHIARGEQPEQCRQNCSEGFMSAPPRRVQMMEPRPRYAPPRYRPRMRMIMRPQYRRQQFRPYRPHHYEGPHFRQAPSMMRQQRRTPPTPGPQWRGQARQPIYTPPPASGGPMELPHKGFRVGGSQGSGPMELNH